MHESGEMYLETIYVLSQKGDIVRSIDVSEYMSFSKPSVSRAMGLLRQDGYIEIDRKGGIHLTDKGLAVAHSIYDRHETMSAILEVMGVGAETAQRDACRMEHYISEESFAAFKKYFQAELEKRNG